MKQADWLIDIGPDGGKNGGELVLAGTPADMMLTARTLTADSYFKFFYEICNQTYTNIVI